MMSTEAFAGPARVYAGHCASGASVETEHE